MTKVAEDALQRRIARFIADAPTGSAENSYLWLTAASDIGQLRKENQDRCIALTASYSFAPDKNFTLAVVCDGIGGMANGAEAATLALSTFASHVIRTTTMHGRERLRVAAGAANDCVYNRYSGNGGTTLSAVLMMDPLEAYCVNIGDSRVYGISRDKSLVPLTKDDTLAEHLRNPDNIPPGQEGRLLQYIGVGEDLEPNIDTFFRDEYSSIFLTSDGVHGAPVAAIEQVARRAKDTRDLSSKSLKLADALGGRDNATIVSIDSLIQHRLFIDQGLTLTFLSPWDRLELWIPRVNDDAKQERLPEALTEASRTSVSSYKNDADATRTRKRAKSRRKTSTVRQSTDLLSDYRKSTDPSINGSDEGPKLNIDFPTDTQD